jgi:chromosome segregation ATPase
VEFRNSFPCFLFVRVFSDALTSRSACWWQELERRARERYVVLDRLDADFRWYLEQYEALEALVEALRSPDRCLSYKDEALLDSLPEQGAQAAEGASAVMRVQTVLVERDDALRRAREDLEGACSLATTWETEVATARAQLQRGRAALQEAEGLKAALADKAAALAAAEEQLRQERAARQEAEGQLQREQAVVVETRAALEQERMAREEALGQFQQERVALEEARATLQKQEEEVSRLNGELVQLNISHKDQRQSLEEQEALYLKLQREAEETRRSLEVEKKRVEGKFVFVRFSFVDSFSVLLIFPSGIRSRLYLPCSWSPGLRTALGHATTRAETLQTAYNSSQQELEELQAAALDTCQAVEEGEAQVGSSLASRLRALSVHVSRCMRRALHLGVQKALGVVGSHYQVNFEAVASGYIVLEGVKDEVAMERAVTLATAAAETLAEDFEDFLFPDAPDAGEPQA